MVERRRFSRVIYQAPAVITQDDKLVNAHLQDLSLHGLLLNCDQSCQALDTKKTVSIQFTLPDSDVVIELVADLINIRSNVIRASIHHIDIDSIGHLKRLVELNVGDDSLLHRELEHLSDLGDHS